MNLLKLSLFLGLVLGNFTQNSHEQLGVASRALVDKLTAALNNILPNSLLGERSEFKKTALEDHVNDDSFDSSTQEIIEEAKFRSVTHMVTSSDGYKTELINIINPLADRSKLKQPPVIMFHGALIDTTAFVWAGIRQHHPERYPRNLDEDGPITSSNRSLAFVLANNGYDVWLAGTRGSNKQNMGHAHYKAQLLEDLLSELWSKPTAAHARRIIDTLKYLDFTQDELVEIEYPKQIDEVLRITNSWQVSVVTYSKSASIVFKLLASDSVHSRRIHSHVTLGPVGNLVGSSNVWKLVAKIAVSLPNPVGNLLYTQIITASWTRQLISKLPRYSLAWYLSTTIGGPSPRFLTFLELPVIGHLFMPYSLTEAKHLCQQMLTGKLQKYDHGKEGNRLAYNGSDTPPQYDITNIKLKRWMMVSADLDVLGTLDSAQKYNDLHQHKPDKWIRLKSANHIDLTASFEHDVKVNLPILEFMEKFQIKAIE